MKTIIAPLDFSDSSFNALNFAAELANRAKARLIIMHAQKTSDDKDDSERKLKSAEKALKINFDTNFSCEIYISNGNLMEAMNDLIPKLKPDLIVMGTKGATGLKRIFIGSNTVNVISMPCG